MTIEKSMFYGASPNTFEKAAELRKNMTDTEKVLWLELKNRKVFKTKFRRQHPIDIFVVDFYCHEYKLVIEVDGKIHLKKDIQEYDKGRQAELENLGITVLRFTNEQINTDIEAVKRKILDYIGNMDDDTQIN